MRKSIFTQSYTAEGVIKTVKGEIQILMNDKSLSVVSTHPSTHDDYRRTSYIHRVTATIDGEEWRTKELSSEEAVLEYVEKLVPELRQQIEHISNTIPAKTFAEKLGDILNKR